MMTIGQQASVAKLHKNYNAAFSLYCKAAAHAEYIEKNIQKANHFIEQAFRINRIQGAK